MSQFEYNDLNKFYVSVGVFLIGFTFLLPWLYLQEEFDLTIKVEELELYTIKAQEIIRNRQNISGTLILLIPIISILSFVTGIVLSIKGIKGWRKLQQISEDREVMINRELSLKIDKLSTEEHTAKVEEEISSQIDEKPDLWSEKKKLVTNYLNAERKFIQIIKPVFETEYKIFVNTRIGKNEYDIILRSPLKMDKDIVFEIKYTENRIGGNHFHKSLAQLENNLINYRENVKKNTEGRIVYLLKQNSVQARKNISSLLPDNSIELLEDRDRHLRSTQVRVAYFELNELDTLSPNQILRRLKLGN